MKNFVLIFICLATLSACNRSIPTKGINPLSQITIDEINADYTINVWGRITDAQTGEALPFANLTIHKDSKLITGVQTDFDGIYKVRNLDAGTYDFEVTYSGYNSERITGVIIYSEHRNKLDFALSTGTFLGCGPLIIHKIPLIKQDETTSGQTFDSDFIKRMAW